MRKKETTLGYRCCFFLSHFRRKKQNIRYDLCILIFFCLLLSRTKEDKITVKICNQASIQRIRYYYTTERFHRNLYIRHVHLTNENSSRRASQPMRTQRRVVGQWGGAMYFMAWPMRDHNVRHRQKRCVSYKKKLQMPKTLLCRFLASEDVL